MESHNGTYLNDTLLAEPVLLTSGDRLCIGETVLRFIAFCGEDFVWSTGGGDRGAADAEAM